MRTTVQPDYEIFHTRRENRDVGAGAEGSCPHFLASNAIVPLLNADEHFLHNHSSVEILNAR